MKQTFYILENKSGSEGMYLKNGVYKTLYPNERIELTVPPTNKTENITLTIYKKEVGEEKILRKISK